MLYIIFFLSGAAGLLYEVVWTRQLTFILGVTAPAVSTVLATFMAGLGIGGALAGRMLKNRHPGKFYAFCEVGIAITGAAGPLLLGLMAPVYVLAKQTFGGGTMLTITRAAVAGIVLLPPGILMGATLPALSKWLLSTGSRAGRSIGLLYSINTLGAVAGTLGAAFFGIEILGTHGTIALAAALNLIVAAAALHRARRDPAAPDFSNITNNNIHIPAAPGARTALVVALLSGAAALACEGIWTRYLIYAVGDNSAYAFAGMLAMFLLGLALGGMFISTFVDRIKNPLMGLAVLQGLLAAACVFSVAQLDAKGRYAGFGDPYSDDVTASWSEFLLAGLFSTIKVVLPPTFLFGASFPLITKIVTRGASTAASDVGRALAWNTTGAIGGALAGGFILLPALGFAKGMIAVGIVNFAACAVALAAAPSGRAVRAGAAAVFLILLIGAAQFALDVRDAAARALVHDSRRDRMVFYEDSAVSSVAVVEDTKTGFRTLYVGGDGQASTDPTGMLHLRLLGHLPAFFHENPKSGLVVCCGAGVTLGSLASHPLESIEVCDLSPTIININKNGMFDGGNGGVFRDPRLSVTVDDGRNHLLSTRRKWDVITTDPIDPDDAGVTSIYCREYYQLVADRLNPGGVACQWITIQYSLDVYKSLVAAFREVFPDCYIYDADFTTVIVGRKPGGRPPDFERFERAFADSRVRESLSDVGIDDPYDLLSLQIAGPAAIAKFCEGVTPNSDDHPIAETVAPRTAWGHKRGDTTKKMEAILALREAGRADTVRDWSPAHAAKFKNKFEGMQRAFEARLFTTDDPARRIDGVIALLKSLVSTAPRTTELMAQFDRCEFSPRDDVSEYLLQMDFGIDALDSASTRGVNPVEAARAARFFFENALTLRLESLRARLGLAITAARLGEHAAAVRYCYQFLASSRYGDYYLKPFYDYETELLIRELDDPARHDDAARSLKDLMGVELPPNSGAWMDWLHGRPAAGPLLPGAATATDGNATHTGELRK